MISTKRLITSLGSVAASIALLGTASPVAANSMQCSQKLHSTMYGRTATQEELNIADPLSKVDEMLREVEFHENFGEFVNAHMNWIPADGRNRNPVYMGVTKFLFKPGPNEWIYDEDGVRTDQKYTQELPWEYLFTKGFETYDNGYNPKSVDQCGEPASGYFSNEYWQRTYKGNEESGIKIRTAYMIMNNQIGLNLDALTVSSSGGSGLSSRQNPESVCYACHFATDFALDKVANVLTRVDRSKAADAQGCISIPKGTSQDGEDPAIVEALEQIDTVVYGTQVNNLPELTAMLATLPQFDDNACSIAFKFVFGREKRGSDREVFEPCVTKFEQSGFITTAIKHFLESEYFCPEEAN